MSAARMASIAPLIVFLPACGVSLRAGPRATATGGDAAIQGEVTLAAGLGVGQSQGYVGVPLTLAAGAQLRDGSALVQLESGLELARAIGESRWGFRVSGRAGGTPVGASGAYIGLRGGPMLALEDRQSIKDGGAQLVPTLSLEAITNIGLSEPIAGKPIFGGVLSFGFDFYSGIDMRVRQGRPLRGEGGGFLAAPTRRGQSWSAASRPDLSRSSAEERARLGDAWLADARMEHASIATFAALALNLLALGAPADLVEAAHRAALDEARHARLCFSLASAYLDRALEPGALPIDGASAATASLEELALTSLFDGAFGEGLAAAIARARARFASDPQVRKVLASIARDESRHADLGWSVIRWCVGERGPHLHAELEAAWSRGCKSTSPDMAARQPPSVFAGLERHGLVGPDVVARALDRTRRLVSRRLAARSDTMSAQAPDE